MEKINQLKEKYGVQKSEGLFGIDSPPDYQCDIIDKAVKNIQTAERDISNALKDLSKEENINQGYVSDIEWSVRDMYCIETLESLRKTIEALRAWGNEWKSLAKHLLDSKENIEDFVSDALIVAYDDDMADKETKHEVIESLQHGVSLECAGEIMKNSIKTHYIK